MFAGIFSFPVSTSRAKRLALQMGNCHENEPETCQGRSEHFLRWSRGSVLSHSRRIITLATLYERQTAHFLAAGV